MKLYFVDYENVNSKGLGGIQNLTSKDRVMILYSNQANSVKIKTIQNLLTSKAKVSFIEITSLGQNALDFQLSALIGSYLGKFRGSKLQIYIISKDKGFDSLVRGLPTIFEKELSQKKLILSIQRKATIEGELPIANLPQFTNTKSRLQNSKYTKNMEEIFKIIQRNATLHQDEGKGLICGSIHNALVESFNDRGKLIYAEIKTTLKEDLK